MREIIDYPFLREPRAHQLKCWRLSKDRDYFALFLDMGTGKTKIAIDEITYLYDKGKIDGALIVAPKGVYRNWIDIELPKHAAEHINPLLCWWDSAVSTSLPPEDQIDNAGNPFGVQHRGWMGPDRVNLIERIDWVMNDRSGKLKILAMNIESLNTARGFDTAERFLLACRSYFIIDESSCIKNDKAKRTKAAIELGKLAPVRRIACGNPWSNSPLHVYAPCQFLSEDALGIPSMVAFKARFAQLVPMKIEKFIKNKRRVFRFNRVVGFKDLDKLKKLVLPFSFAVRKDECLDLPPKNYLPARLVAMLPNQQRIYDEMKQRAVAEIEATQLSLPIASPEPEWMLTPEEAADPFSMPGAPVSFDTAGPVITSPLVSAKIVLTKLLRLQQIACGFVTDDAGVEQDLCGDSPNPKIEAMLEAIEETQGKVIIWAPFRRMIDQAIVALETEYGPETVGRFDGTVTDADELARVKREFQDPNSPMRFFAGNPSKGGRGLTLTLADLMLYLSNTYDNEIREQTEDRAHRDGLNHVVNYQNIEAENSTDQKINAALMTKKTVADFMRDGSWKELF